MHQTQGLMTKPVSSGFSTGRRNYPKTRTAAAVSGHLSQSGQVNSQHSFSQGADIGLRRSC